MATINNIDGFVHTIADKPLWREAVQARPLGRERPDRLTEFVQFTEQKNRLANELLERLGTAQTETNRGSTGWTATLETSKATTTNEGSAAGSWPSPQPAFNSNLTHMALTQNVPATRPQSPLTRVAGGIAKAAHAHRGNQAPRPPAVDPLLLTPTGPSRASCHTGAETATWAEEQNSMPSEQHEQWKRDLFNHLERKLNGCIGCGIGEDPEDHLPVHKGHQYDPSQQIIWTCEQMHPHRYDLLRGAGSVAMEKYQSAPNSGRCCPDLTVLNTHREPMAFIEIVRSSRPGNAVKVARELGIPIFTILAPDRKTITPGLIPSQPWWDFDPTLPEEVKQQMRFMEQVSNELMRRNDSGDSTWSQLDVMKDRDGNIQFASFRGAPPNLSEPTFPRTGNMIVAEQCSWTCEESMEVSRSHHLMDMQDADVAMNLELQRKLGRIVLGAMSAAENEPAQFVVPLGSEEVHVRISRHPLNPHISPTDPRPLNIREQFAEAEETVRNRHRRDNINPGSPDSNI